MGSSSESPADEESSKEAQSDLKPVDPEEKTESSTESYEEEASYPSSQESNSSMVIKCRDCGAHYANIPSLNKHVALKHSNKEPKPSFACSKCNHYYSSESHLSEHQRSVHSKSRNRMKCAVCNEEFENSIKLFHHKRKQHPNKNSKTCPICGRKFANEANLNSHTKQFHSKEGEKVKTHKTKPSALIFKDRRKKRSKKRLKTMDYSSDDSWEPNRILPKRGRPSKLDNT
eukprot:Platyproteum_vivax@DN7117_c0_g1_i2.p1